MEYFIGAITVFICWALLLGGETLIFAGVATVATLTLLFIYPPRSDSDTHRGGNGHHRVGNGAIGSVHAEVTTDSSEPKPSEKLDNFAGNMERDLDEIHESVARVGEGVTRLRLMLADLEIKQHCPELYPMFPEVWTPAPEEQEAEGEMCEEPEKQD